ncbi:structural maintenance of chromosomes protein 6-like isoform X3 [Branchiostoma floridae]|uniref:Structural maintenance of chromosomes protein 6 n=1 Tax=Branchiostoma floridae TaxID=7739 RepID=A0A9J7HYF4_BRAFL|nr:structural maintenance of chromosomes protein 6-like isoform X3 [Branchiostoma floridae]
MVKRKGSNTEVDQPSTSKRARAQSGHHEEDPDVEEEEEEGDGAGEEDVMNLTQGDPNLNHPNEVKEADTGIIEAISLKNFMCHSRLEFKFGPNVNFVVGKNGSGKSAVLTGLVVGLGGKATITDRGKSIKSFIKHGQNAAEVAIRIRNRGLEAYKPDEYGEAVIVERRLAQDGATSYRLKSIKGKTISTKREELSHVLDHFNIQVDNPVSILNQDTSRNFLHSRNASDKYKFFLKATQLEQMSSDYSTIQEQREEIQATLRTKEETVPQLEKIVSEKEQRFKDLATLQELEKKVEGLKNMYAWAQVHELEKQLEPIAKAIKQEEARTPKYDQKVQESMKKVEAAEAKHQDIQQKLQELADKVQALNPKHEEAKANLKLKKDACKKTQAEHRKVLNQLKTTKRDREQVMERIDEMKDSVQQDYEAERRAREEQIRLLQEQLQKLQAQQTTTDHQIDQFAQAVTLYKEQLYNLKRDEQDIQNTTRQLQRRLQDLQSSRNNSLKRFGNFMPDLVRQINQAYQQGRFHQKPRGPLGSCISLRDPELALAVESCLKNLMFAFCANDHHDERVLEGIMKQVCPQGRRPSIIISRFHERPYDVSTNRVQHPDYPAVLDVLDIEDPVVSNFLIDQRKIECVLMIKDNKEARQVMQLQRPPRNCNEAFTAMGDQVYTNRYYSSNTDKSSYLRVSIEEEVQETQERLQRLQQDGSATRQQLAELEQDIRKNQQEQRRHQTQKMKTQESINKIQYEIRDLQSVEEPTPVDVSTLEEEVMMYDEQIKSLEEKMETIETDFNAQKEDLEEAESAYQQIDQQIRELADSADPLKDDLGRADIEISQAKQHRKHYEQKHKEHLKKIADMQKEHDKHAKKVEEETGKAFQICPERLKVRRTAKNIENEIVQIQKRIAQEEVKRGNREEVTKDYYESREQFGTIKDQIRELKRFIKSLDEIMFQRQQLYKDFRRMLALRSNHFFINMLHQRGFSGKMKFDHRVCTLSLEVQSSESNKQVTKDMRSLSGGERSFSTVCFILALWDSMESPFRCLDEFDVFMDMVNRRISMEMMMKVAQDHRHKQFIFLTPQDMSYLRDQSIMRMWRMPDPDRGTGVLPFERRVEEEDDDRRN